MARYDFKCVTCGVVQEHIQPMSQVLPETLPCPKCGERAEQVILVAPAVATSGMGQAPIDVVVGRDADARWSDIRRRQGLREQVRQQSGETGLTATGRNEFQPIGDTQKAARSDAMKTVERSGFKPEYDNSGDRKLVHRDN